MFAYCLNNPVAHADAAGSAAKACLTADGAIDDAPWRDHGPRGGGIIYHNNNITNEHNTDILGKFSKLIKGSAKVNKACQMIKAGANLLALPAPTLAEDLIGIGLAAAGIIWGSFGVVEVIIWIDDQL